MFIYVATTPYLRQFSIWKIGCTKYPRLRLATYLTGCPPNMTPSNDMAFEGLWETTANSRIELEEIEERVHDYFLKYRMQRCRPGDSEWFNFQGLNAIELIARFFECARNACTSHASHTMIKRMIPQCEIKDLLAQQEVSQNMFLNKMVHKNFRIINDQTRRTCELDEIQGPVIKKVADFIQGSLRACYIIAPCGSGKTVMICKGICEFAKNALHYHLRVIICAPTNQIQVQWHDTLIAWNAMQEEDIHYVGGAGTTDPDVIKEIMMRGSSHEQSYCILSTYASSKLMTDLVTCDNVDLIVLDEAHHMVGRVAQDEMSNEGITRTFMSRVADLNIHRISLTYTPRFIRNEFDANSKYLSMDDERIFGNLLAKVNLRDLIKRGILPDYYVWSLYDKSRRGAGLLGRAECLLEAWRATESVRIVSRVSTRQSPNGVDRTTRGTRYIVDHLIVFARLIEEAKKLEEYFRARVAPSDLVLRADSGSAEHLRDVIARFSAAPRAILVNCYVLSEGVDIPRANAVAIMYPKRSYSQIVQMILRAGRWAPDKPVFHVLVPIIDDEDMSGYEEVLSSLAADDERIYNEVIDLAATGSVSESDSAQSLAGIDSSMFLDGEIPEHIILEEYASTDIAQIKERFANIRRTIFTHAEIAFVRKVCAENNVDTSVDYAILRARMKFPELPKDPRMLDETWYDFLHCASAATERITRKKFATCILIPNKLHVGWKYDEWHKAQPAEISQRLPSVQHIEDGYFGHKFNDFDSIIELHINIDVGCANSRR